MTQVTSLFENHFIEWIAQLGQRNSPDTHVSEEKIEKFYTLAYAHYTKQNYCEAAHVFRLLVASRPTDSKYWKGLGASLQMQQQYEEALNCYLSAQMVTKGEPDPYIYLHAADCYFAIQAIPSGLKALEAAEAIAKKTNDRRMLHHIKFMLSRWSFKSTSKKG